jgi:hypothetical protein
VPWLQHKRKKSKLILKNTPQKNNLNTEEKQTKNRVRRVISKCTFCVMYRVFIEYSAFSKTWQRSSEMRKFWEM